MILEVFVCLQTVLLHLLSIIAQKENLSKINCSNNNILLFFMKDVVLYLTESSDGKKFGEDGEVQMKKVAENTGFRDHIVSHSYAVRDSIVRCTPTGSYSAVDFIELMDLLRGALNGWVNHEDGLARHLDDCEVQNLKQNLAVIQLGEGK